MAEQTGMRWAILGTGTVSRKFVAGLKAVPGHSAVVCASRTPENATAFARDFGLETATYAAAAAHAKVDAVYIATPPSEHEAHAGLAIAAGKPVLIEKPFALDAAGAARIAEAARAANVFVMEGMWTRFLPLTQALKQRLDAGDAGTPRAFTGHFFGSDVPDAAVSLFDPARGGGALMHRGIYGLSLARHFLGPIVELEAMGRVGETGVDEECVLTLRHESGAISTVQAGLRAAGINTATIYGTKATYCLAPPIYRPFTARRIAMTPRVGGTGGQGGGRLEGLKESGFAQGLNQRLARLKDFLRPPGRTISHPFTGNGYGHEAAALAEAVARGLGESPVMPVSESVELMEWIDRARALMNGDAHP